LLLSTGASDDVDSSEGTPLHVSAVREKFGVRDFIGAPHRYY